MEFNEFQREANRTDQRPGHDEGALLFPVIGLSSEVGSLVRHVKKRLRDGDAHELFSDEMAEELGDVLWYVANLAEKLDLELEEVAERNLRKIRGRWPQHGQTLPLPIGDEQFPEHERLPRHTHVRFVESQEDGKTIVRLYGPDGQQLGNQLTDNAYEDDGYRYHDVFHLSYAALLGWSPLTRLFFDVKRNSDPKVREVEDAGRATVIEEAIAAFVFDYGRDERFLEGVDHVDFSLLQAIRRLVSRLEVRDRSAHDWEQTILRGFAVWRELYAARGGVVRLDLVGRTIDFEPDA
ncbi:MAG: nucleoside triphosphate pyrophosphohydrolase family protein [Solirubrobacterales bacterium]